MGIFFFFWDVLYKYSYDTGWFIRTVTDIIVFILMQETIDNASPIHKSYVLRRD